MKKSDVKYHRILPEKNCVSVTLIRVLHFTLF